jgi:hypothetical protein
MATLMFWFGSAVDAIKGIFARPQSRHDALFILEDIDKYRNLHSSLAIISFFTSAGLAVLAFFLINESILCVGINEQVALLLVSISWVLIFPIWALIFLFMMSVLYVMGIMDVRSVVRYRFSNLTLSRDQLHELHNILASRSWRHGRIFKRVIADLTKERLNS